MKNIREELLQAFDAIKGTVEYELITANNFDDLTYAYKDDKCEWWSSRYAHYMLDSINEIIESYEEDEEEQNND